MAVRTVLLLVAEQLIHLSGKWSLCQSATHVGVIRITPKYTTSSAGIQSYGPFPNCPQTNRPVIPCKTLRRWCPLPLERRLGSGENAIWSSVDTRRFCAKLGLGGSCVKKKIPVEVKDKATPLPKKLR